MQTIAEMQRIPEFGVIEIGCPTQYSCSGQSFRWCATQVSDRRFTGGQRVLAGGRWSAGGRVSSPTRRQGIASSRVITHGPIVRSGNPGPVTPAARAYHHLRRHTRRQIWRETPLQARESPGDGPGREGRGGERTEGARSIVFTGRARRRRYPSRSLAASQQLAAGRQR